MSDALGRHAVALASVHELAARSGAQRVVLLVDEGEDSDATMIEYAGNELELTEAGVTQPVSPRRDRPGGAGGAARPHAGAGLGADRRSRQR